MNHDYLTEKKHNYIGMIKWSMIMSTEYIKLNLIMTTQERQNEADYNLKYERQT